jgi:hypothetical protein
MMPINLAEKLARFDEYWQPRVGGDFNGHDLMVVKVKGEFLWHEHADTDDRQQWVAGVGGLRACCVLVSSA